MCSTCFIPLYSIVNNLYRNFRSNLIFKYRHTLFPLHQLCQLQKKKITFCVFISYCVLFSVPGTQRIVYGCFDRASNDKVDDERCRFLEDRSTPDVVCEMVDCDAIQ